MKITLLLCVFADVCQASGILTVTPSAGLQGQPGTTVGWGYSLLDHSGWAVPSFSEFDTDSSDGLYADYVSLGANYVVIPPGTPGGQDFDLTQQTGLGEFYILPSATPGEIITGTIILHYDLYSQDPDINPVILSLDNQISENVAIEVTNPATDTPEPATAGLVLAGLALAGGALRRGDRCAKIFLRIRRPAVHVTQYSGFPWHCSKPKAPRSTA